MKKGMIVVAIVVAVSGVYGLGFLLGRAERQTGPPTANSHRDVLYHCPMHPRIVSDKPGHCPICQMTWSRTSTEPKAAAGAPIEGLAAISLSARQRQLLGTRTVRVERAPFLKTVRAVGLVTVDERRMQHVHTKIQGWIEHLHAGAVGETVRRGDPLLTIYSPELLATQREFLVALDNRARVSSTMPEIVARRRPARRGDAPKASAPGHDARRKSTSSPRLAKPRRS